MKTIAVNVATDIERAVQAERQRCADVAQFYPVETWAGDLADAIWIRDDISQAITRGLKPTEPLT